MEVLHVAIKMIILPLKGVIRRKIRRNALMKVVDNENIIGVLDYVKIA